MLEIDTWLYIVITSRTRRVRQRLTAAPSLVDMWKEYVAGHERIEGERKLTQTEKVKEERILLPH